MYFSRFLTILLLFAAMTAQSQVALNEFLASNNSTIQDPDFQVFADWIELHNNSNDPVDLSGWWLSDDADILDKWVFPSGTSIPANGFLLVWADGQNTGLHTNYKLSAAGEKLILSNSLGLEMDKISFAAQLTDVSQGRKVDGTGDWGFFTQPTPGASNVLNPFFDDYTKPVPHFSVAGGFFTAAVLVDIQNLSSSGAVYYTTDGAVPTANSAVFTQALEFNTNTVVKARIIAPGRIPGPVLTNTYFVGEDFQQRGLAVLSLSGDPADFFGVDSGILVQNYKPDREIPIHLEFYENDGLLGFHHDAGGSVGGENSWILPQKLLNISSRKQYGGGHIEYQIFPDKARTRFEDIILRTSGNDWSNTIFRDGLMQNTASSTADLDMQGFRPVSTFINGVYYGIYNIREKQDKEYAELYHGITADSLDYIENDGEIKEGNAEAYQQMVALLDAGVQSDADFQNLANICDVRNFTDYIISEIFVANTSWGHNIALFRKRSPEAKWRWFPHDYDRGFNPNEAGGTAMEWATSTNGPDWSNGPFATLFLRKMLENNAFKESFITRFADHLFVTWNPQWVNPRIDQHAAWVRNEIPYHVGEWAGTSSSYGDGIPSVQFWENEVAKLKTFDQQRNAFMFDNLAQFFSLAGTSGLNVQVSDPAHGQVRLHDMPFLPAYPWFGKYFQNRPFTLTAEARPGFNFVRWEKTSDSSALLLAAGSNWKYRDTDTAPSDDWKLTSFDDSGWSEGPAQLGYGDNDEVTILNFGSDPNNKIPTYYFRQKFVADDPSGLTQLIVRLIADDGAVVYLNGQEVWRQNMPGGTIDFNTLASGTIGAPGENAWNEQSIPASALMPGENTIAVEVHQAVANSSDVSFDLEIRSVFGGSQQILSTEPVLTTSIPDANPINLRAVFESNGNCGILPDTIRQNLTLTQACSPYDAVSDVVVLPSVTLTVENGVEIRFPEGANLWVLGDLQIHGTANDPVLIKSLPNGQAWGGIFLKNTTGKSKMQYLSLENASAGTHRIYFPAAISAYHADMELDHLTLTKVTDNPIFARFSDVTLTNSNIRSVVTGDGINLKQGKGRVENCTFTALGTLLPDMDAIDFDGITDGMMRNNVIHDFRGDNCDGLDIGEQCHNLLIEGNFIYHCFDKGISVGQQSTATIRNNTIAYTAIGIALKDQSPVIVDHCTLFGNQTGIAAYEKNAGSLGGNGIISNCIVSNVAFDPFNADSLSSLNVSNCLSGTDTLTGTGNLTADPHFVNPTQYNFNLMPGSPALGAGNDGADLGANPMPDYSGQPQVMFSEILYHDTLTTTDEFLELHNPGSQPVELGGYTLFGALDYVFPTGASIAPGEYLVVARDAAKFPANAPYQVFQWASGKLADEGEKILLYDATGLLVDFVRYNNHAPWPEVNTMFGKSLELASVDLDNHFASSWQPSGPWGGTPGGQSNSVGTNSPNTLGTELAIFPNPAGSSVRISVKNAESGTVFLQITDLNGRVVYSEKLSHPGGLLIKPLDVSGFTSGMYVVRALDAEYNLLGLERLVIERR
jgi:hypothetical protein